METPESMSPPPNHHNHTYHADNGQYVALLSHDATEILMSSALGNPAIPTLDTSTYNAITTEPYRAIVCDLLGIASDRTHVIEEYTFDEHEQFDDVSVTIIHVLSTEVHVRSPLAWLDARKNNVLSLSTPTHPSVSNYLITFLDNLGSWTPRNAYLPWYRFGFYQKLEPLLTKSLEKADYQITGPLEQVRFSTHSSTYRIPSKPHDIFFKACPKGSNEPRTAQILCELFPNDFVSLVCLVPELNGFLTLNAGSELQNLIAGLIDSENTDDSDDETEVLDSAIKFWADFQQRSASHIPQLIESGIRVCDKPWVVEGAKQLTTYCRSEKLLPEEQLAKLEACYAIIEQTFTLWKQSGIPETIVHGDFCASNLARLDGSDARFVAFDFCTVFIGCPFFDLRDPKWSTLHTRQATYLQCWERYADARTIEMLAELIKPMQYLIEAILVMHDETVWTESMPSEILSNVESLLEEAENLRVCGFDLNLNHDKDVC